MKTNILLFALLVLSSCDPCRKLSKPKYQKCFSAVPNEVKTKEIKDTFNIHLQINDTTVYNFIDSILYYDSCLTTERKESIKRSIKSNVSNFISDTDTTIANSDYDLSISVQGGKIRYNITIHPQECDCPPTFIYKERIKWWWGWVVGIIILVLFIRKK